MKLQKIEQSEKYPNETTSFIMGNCFDQKQTAEIVHRCNCYGDLLEALKLVWGKLDGLRKPGINLYVKDEIVEKAKQAIVNAEKEGK